jgi:hypothetical protein
MFDFIKNSESKKKIKQLGKENLQKNNTKQLEVEK